MRIQSSTVAMASRHELSITHEKSERLETWVDPPQVPPAEAPAPPAKPQFEPSALEKMKIELLQKLLEAFTGETIELKIPEAPDPAEAEELAKKLGALMQNAREVRPRQGWGMRYESHERYAEHESSMVAAGGIVKTADGQEIAFSVDLRMHRSFVREESVLIEAGDRKLKDPLVVNFDAPAAQLTQTKFQFDLDADGEEDQISFLRPGSGFLTQDLDGNGVINDGREVFGALSGDAYADLAAHDDDGNGWLDEGDAIFDKLRIWTKDAQGRDQLFALGEKGIGALFLGATLSPYSLKDTDNALHGQVRRTGVFLREDGSAGTLQQIDLAV
jgi:hypothetical protein